MESTWCFYSAGFEYKTVLYIDMVGETDKILSWRKNAMILNGIDLAWKSDKEHDVELSDQRVQMVKGISINHNWM